MTTAAEEGMRAMTGARTERTVWAAEVGAAVSALPAEQGQALRLRYFERLTDTDVAARMGLSQRATRRVVAVGLCNLGRALYTANTV